MASAAGLLDLPEELLLAIARKTQSAAAVLRLGSSCRALRRLLMHNDALWADLYRKRWGQREVCRDPKRTADACATIYAKRARLEGKVMQLVEESDPPEPKMHHVLAKQLQLSPLFAARCVLAMGCFPERSQREFAMHLDFIWWPALVSVLYHDLRAAVEQRVRPEGPAGEGAQGKAARDVLEDAVLVLARVASPITYLANAHLEVERFLEESSALLRPQVDALQPEEESDAGFGLGSARVNVLLTHLFERVGLRLGNQAHGVRRLLDTKKGLPIDLCALLVLLGKRLGIKLDMIGFPGTYFVAFESGPSEVYRCFSPMLGYQLRTREEVIGMCSPQIRVAAVASFERPDTPRQVAARMVRNMCMRLELVLPPFVSVPNLSMQLQTVAKGLEEYSAY